MEGKTPIENVRLSFACDKVYENMTPCSSGRHCSSCNKIVVDFTDKDQETLRKALEEHGSVCGRFKKEQVTRIDKRAWNFKRFAASLLLAIGLSSFIKELKAQITSSDTLNNEKKYFETAFLGMIIEPMPTYINGGEQGLFNFVKKNFNYPCDTASGTVYVSFTVDTSGKVIDAKIAKSLSPESDSEALRVVKLLEFTPGRQNGKKVPIQFTLPISVGKPKD